MKSKKYYKYVIILLLFIFIGCESKYATIEEKRILQNKYIIKIQMSWGDVGGIIKYCQITENKFNLYKKNDKIIPDYSNCEDSIDDIIKK